MLNKSVTECAHWQDFNLGLGYTFENESRDMRCGMIFSIFQTVQKDCIFAKGCFPTAFAAGKLRVRPCLYTTMDCLAKIMEIIDYLLLTHRVSLFIEHTTVCF